MRRVEDITEALWGSKVSPATISDQCRENIIKRKLRSSGHSVGICEWCGEKFLDSSGQSFRQSKRRTQSGRCPRSAWQAEEVVEISEEEFEYLLSKSIVPFKAKKTVMVGFIVIRD